MFSNYDIQKEMVKGNICVIPLNMNNLKENSLNLCTSKYAYVLKDYTFKHKGKEFKLHKGESAIKQIDGVDKIVLPPHRVVWIVTKEFLSVSGKIGGAYHSKVGIAMKGISHIGTMLGPNFKGYSVVPIVNNTDELLFLDVGESFVSVTFDYLKTRVKEENATKNAHMDKFMQQGICVKDIENLDEDWMSKNNQIIEHFKSEDEYKKLKKIQDQLILYKIRQYISFRNFIYLILILMIMAVVFIALDKMELDTKLSFIIEYILMPLISILLLKITIKER